MTKYRLQVVWNKIKYFSKM